MHLRRAIAIAAIAGMGLTLTACGQKSAGTPTVADSAASSVAVGTSGSASSVTGSDAPSSSDASSSQRAASSTAAPDPATSDTGATESSDASSTSAATSPSSTSAGKTPGDAAAASTPAWGYPGTSSGKKLGVVKNASIEVAVYQVAITKSAKQSLLVDATTKKPLIQVGDKIVWVNYVITNVGSKPIDLGYTLVDVQAMYPDWKYLSGMAGITDSAQAKEVGVHTFPIKPNTGDAPFTLAPGQSYAVGENFAYHGPKELDLKVTVTPADAKGKLIHDKTQKFEGSVKIA